MQEKEELIDLSLRHIVLGFLLSASAFAIFAFAIFAGQIRNADSELANSVRETAPVERRIIHDLSVMRTFAYLLGFDQLFDSQAIEECRTALPNDGRCENISITLRPHLEAILSTSESNKSEVLGSIEARAVLNQSKKISLEEPLSAIYYILLTSLLLSFTAAVFYID